MVEDFKFQYALNPEVYIYLIAREIGSFTKATNITNHSSVRRDVKLKASLSAVKLPDDVIIVLMYYIFIL